MKKNLLIICMGVLLLGCSDLKSKYFDFSLLKLKNYSISEKKNIPKRRIMIGNFYNYSRVGTDESDVIAREILINKLKKNNNFFIVEDKSKNSFIEKLAFLEPKDADFSMLKRNYLDIDYIVTGSLISYNWIREKQKNMFYNFNLNNAEIQLELKIVDVVTGEIWNEVESGISYLATSNQNELESDDFFYQKLEKNTLKKAIESAGDKIIKKIETTPWSAIVLEKKGNRLYIDMHKEKILEKKTKFDVYQQGELISYKEKVLGYEEKLVGVAELVAYGNQGKAILKYKGVDFLLPAVVKLK